MERCSAVDPDLYEVDGALVRCLLYEPNSGFNGRRVSDHD